MEVLKIEEWINIQTNRQFRVANKSTSPYFNRYVRRFLDGRVFEVNELVYHDVFKNVMAIYYFHNNCVHFVMENGEMWEANDVKRWEKANYNDRS